VLLAKAIQDSRLFDMPLSTPFLKLLCQGDVSCPVHLISDSQRKNNTAYPRAPQKQQHLAPTQPPSNAKDYSMTSSVLSQDGDGLSGSKKPGGSLDSSQPLFSGYLSHEDILENNRPFLGPLSFKKKRFSLNFIKESKSNQNIKEVFEL